MTLLFTLQATSRTLPRSAERVSHCPFARKANLPPSRVSAFPHSVAFWCACPSDGAWRCVYSLTLNTSAEARWGRGQRPIGTFLKPASTIAGQAPRFTAASTS